MARKQYLAIHRYHSDEVKKQFFTPHRSKIGKPILSGRRAELLKKQNALGIG
jgi:hypothetical protein